MDYLINVNTIYVKYDGINTFVFEKDRSYCFLGNLLNKILNNSCEYYGSSFKGRLKGAKSLIKSRYKLPIIVSEKSNIVFFSFKDIENNYYWFSFNNIIGYEKIDKNLKIWFCNEKSIILKSSYTVFNNQILKCSGLLVNYQRR